MDDGRGGQGGIVLRCVEIDWIGWLGGITEMPGYLYSTFALIQPEKPVLRAAQRST